MLQYMNKTKRFDMPQNSPENYTWITYFWVFGLSILGGIVRTITGTKEGDSPNKIAYRLLANAVISIFVGLVTFFFCEFARFEPIFTAGIVALTAHMGTPALVAAQSYLYQKATGEKL